MNRYPLIINPEIDQTNPTATLENRSNGGMNISGQSQEQLGQNITQALDSSDRSLWSNESIRHYRHCYPSRRQADDEDINHISESEILLSRHDRSASVGQILFHGGEWPRNSDGEPIEKFITDRIFATSLAAEVAIQHVMDETLNSERKEVWILKVSENSNPTPALLFPYEEMLKHELELAFAPGATVTLRKTEALGEISYFHADIS